MTTPALASTALVRPARADARLACHAELARGSKSFALAARLLPSASRTDVAVLYTFCRRVDDAIDLCPPGEQPRALETLRARVSSVYRGDEQPDVAWQAFAELVASAGIPREYPDELLAGMQMDVEGAHYETIDDLLAYCHRVAGVVGLMLCHVFGLSRTSALRNAAHLGLAMQLTNICRDVAEDWDNGRLYLPERELMRAGVAQLSTELGKPFPATAHAPAARVVRELLRLADRFYRSADKGLFALPFRAALSVRAASRVYAAIGERLGARGYDALAGRVVVSTARKLAIVLGSATESLTELPARLVARPQYLRPERIAHYPEDVLP